MNVFYEILFKLIPLYFLIFLGFVAGKYLKVSKESIAHLLIYMISPVIIFFGSYSAQITPETMSIPILVYSVCTSIALVFFYLGKMVFKRDTSKNILAFTAGAGNAGYFGLPVTLAILGNEAFSYATLAILGFILYENTVGFFLTAKANSTVRDSFRKISRLPTIYAFFAGIVLNSSGIRLGPSVESLVTQFKGVYTILGMMIIGMGLVTVKIHHIDLKFITLAFMAKFVVWPAIMLSIVYANIAKLHFYPVAVLNVLIVMAIVPMAANTVAVATELKVHPDKAAITVLLSTLFALFYIPLMSGLLIGV